VAYPVSTSLFLRTPMAPGRAALALRAARRVASSSPFPAAPAAAPAVAPNAELKWAVPFSRTHQNSAAGGAQPHRRPTAAAAAAVGYPAPPHHHVQQRRGLAAGATCGGGGAATGADTGAARRGRSNNCTKQIGPVTLNFSKLVKKGEGPLAAYERLSKDGTLRWDAAQHSALEVGPTLILFPSAHNLFMPRRFLGILSHPLEPLEPPLELPRDRVPGLRSRCWTTCTSISPQRNASQPRRRAAGSARCPRRWAAAAGPGRQCPPRHRTPFNSRNEG